MLLSVLVILCGIVVGRGDNIVCTVFVLAIVTTVYDTSLRVRVGILVLLIALFT